MANEEHLAILKQGVAAWNEWRRESPGERPDVSDANLEGGDLFSADLFSADLSRTNLFGTDLRQAILSQAILSQADLSQAMLINTDLRQADLRRADLRGAILRRANLIDANLRGAEISPADLIDANLSQADLSRTTLNEVILRGAMFTQTIFSSTIVTAVDLGGVHGLDTVEHHGPSSLGLDTIERSQGQIPESFLRGCGVSDRLIAYIPSLTTQPIQYYSTFISYSSQDEALAKRLHADLQVAGVRCWFAPHDLPIGARIRVGIDEAIRLHDKLLLILSKHSVGSDWVEKEVETAMEQERRHKRTVLFPIRLDPAVMKIESGWPADVRRGRNIGDFCKWKDHGAYQMAFARLLRDLRAEGATG